MLPLLSLNQLRIFTTVAKEGSFTKAAKVLRVTQPAISIQMNQLEAALQVKLLDRMSRTIAVTAEGRVLLENAKKIFDLLSNIELELATLKGLKSGSMTLGASTIPSAMILPAAIAAFRQKYPQTHFALRVARSDVVERWVVDNEVDLAMIWGDPVSPNVSKEYFSAEELVLVVPPGHPLSKRKSVSPNQIYNEYLLLPESGKLRPLIENFFIDKGLPIKNYTVFGNAEAIKTAVSAGLGLSILSRSSVEREVRAGFIVIKKIRDISLKYNVNIIYHKDKHFSPLALAFRQFLRERANLLS